ncbi:LytTR family two component transcriptional regulator [Pedobacter cryoconitis]|uniref:LytTR family two component transcriptional regulator n=1 Tax=Pedobacter cryoconitis TaxID=188932 RepID=A0A127VEM2_9SPHI|nr:LytTR family DNA-binding domain-containing protein [Pedobacter cryoconitis]AMP99739.1 LytTR family two component transcriptional regulator [Pedobacter cryoconitis]
MISCYVIDNEDYNTNLLTEFIKTTPGLTLKGTSKNPLEALDILKTNPPKILFLDMDMPQISGIELSKLIDKKIFIIFVTVHSKYAVDAFDHNALDFLLKPFSYPRFLFAVEKIKKHLHNKSEHTHFEDSFYIRTGIKGKHIRLNFNEIVYIKGALNYVTIHTESAEYLTYITMRDLEESLPPRLFIRVQKSYIVNEKKILYVSNGNIMTTNNIVITVGPSYKESFYLRLNVSTIDQKKTGPN